MSKPVRKPKTEAEKQIYYRDARTKGYYGQIWTTTPKCMFCDLRDKYVFYEENGVVLTVSLYAYIDGDVMIIPRRHVDTASELTSLEWETIRKLMHIARKMVREVYGIRGINFVQRHGGASAQSTVGHYHIKVIPFDAPDMAVWNFRELKNTPVENANKIKEKAGYIAAQAAKFDRKYAHAEHFPVQLQLLITSQQKPGVVVTKDLQLPLAPLHHDEDIDQAARQLAATVIELGSKTKPQLIASNIVTHEHSVYEEHLKREVTHSERALVNTYSIMANPGKVNSPFRWHEPNGTEVWHSLYLNSTRSANE